MRRKKLGLIISCMVISLSMTITGCNNTVTEVNKNVSISKENVKNKTDLEVKSKEIITFNEILSNGEYTFKFNEEGQFLAEQIEQEIDDKLALYGVVNINEDKASIDFLTSVKYENIKNSRVQFYVEEVNEDIVKIKNSISQKAYEINRDLISNESSKYSLVDNTLFEYEYSGDGVVGKINLYNIDTGEKGIVNIGDEYKEVTSANIIGDKIILTAIKNVDGITKPNTIITIDLNNYSIEDEYTIGTFTFMLPIDNEKVLLVSSNSSTNDLSIYNLNNKEKSVLIEYDNGYDEEDDAVNISYAGLFPSKDKIYYCEYTSEKVNINVANINKNGIESPITICEFDINSEYIADPPKIVIGEDETEVFVYFKNDLEGGIEKIYKIKLN